MPSRATSQPAASTVARSDESSRSSYLRSIVYGQPMRLDGLPLNPRSPNYDQDLAAFRVRQTQAQADLALLRAESLNKLQAARVKFIGKWGEIPKDFDTAGPSARPEGGEKRSVPEEVWRDREASKDRPREKDRAEKTGEPPRKQKEEVGPDKGPGPTTKP